LAAKQGFDHQQADHDFPELSRIPYESENAFSACINRINGESYIHVKGSAERVLSMCGTTVTNNALVVPDILHQVDQLAAQGYRVVALASGTMPADNKALEQALGGADIFRLGWDD